MIVDHQSPAEQTVVVDDVNLQSNLVKTTKTGTSSPSLRNTDKDNCYKVVGPETTSPPALPKAATSFRICDILNDKRSPVMFVPSHFSSPTEEDDDGTNFYILVCFKI